MAKKSEPQSVSHSVEKDMDPAAKRALNDFKAQLAKVVVGVLGKYNKVDCSIGRIMDSKDFKYLARKVHITPLLLTSNPLVTCSLYYLIPFPPPSVDTRFDREGNAAQSTGRVVCNGQSKAES